MSLPELPPFDVGDICVVETKEGEMATLCTDEPVFWCCIMWGVETMQVASGSLVELLRCEWETGNTMRVTVRVLRCEVAPHLENRVGTLRGSWLRKASEEEARIEAEVDEFEGLISEQWEIVEKEMGGGPLKGGAPASSSSGTSHFINITDKLKQIMDTYTSGGGGSSTNSRSGSPRMPPPAARGSQRTTPRDTTDSHARQLHHSSSSSSGSATGTPRQMRRNYKPQSPSLNAASPRTAHQQPGKLSLDQGGSPDSDAQHGRERRKKRDTPQSQRARERDRDQRDRARRKLHGDPIDIDDTSDTSSTPTASSSSSSSSTATNSNARLKLPQGDLSEEDVLNLIPMFQRGLATYADLFKLVGQPRARRIHGDMFRRMLSPLVESQRFSNMTFVRTLYESLASITRTSDHLSINFSFDTSTVIQTLPYTRLALDSKLKADPFKVHPLNTVAVVENEARKLVLKNSVRFRVSETGLHGVHPGDIVYVYNSLINLNADVRTERCKGRIDTDMKGRPLLRTDEHDKPLTVNGYYVPHKYDDWLVIKVFRTEIWIGLPALSHVSNIRIE